MIQRNGYNGCSPGLGIEDFHSVRDGYWQGDDGDDDSSGSNDDETLPYSRSWSLYNAHLAGLAGCLLTVQM